MVDAMELAARLELPRAAIEALDRLPLPRDAHRLKTLFHTDRQAFRTFAEGCEDGRLVLRLYLEWALETRAEYQRLGIPEVVFWDSLEDLALWSRDHLARTGRPGLKEWEWVGRTLRLQVIRLGRLQFEPAALKVDVPLPGRTYLAGTPVLDVHIPAGEPLDERKALRSLARAPAFFQRYFGREFGLFHCHSWLLSPDLRGVLPDESRILRFQSLFHIYATDGERQGEERVFGQLSEDAGAYPEHTSVQRLLKAHLLAGGSLGMGAGIRPI